MRSGGGWVHCGGLLSEVKVSTGVHEWVRSTVFQPGLGNFGPLDPLPCRVQLQPWSQSPACSFLVVLKTLISWFRWVWLELELNSGKWILRARVAQPWCNDWEISKQKSPQHKVVQCYLESYQKKYAVLEHYWFILLLLRFQIHLLWSLCLISFRPSPFDFFSHYIIFAGKIICLTQIWFNG